MTSPRTVNLPPQSFSSLPNEPSLPSASFPPVYHTQQSVPVPQNHFYPHNLYAPESWGPPTAPHNPPGTIPQQVPLSMGLTLPVPTNNVPISQGVGVNRTSIQSSIGLIEMGIRDNATQPEHILEIEYCVPAKRSQLFESLRKKGANIKQIDNQRYIAIFKTAVLAKEILLSFKSKDFIMRPFTFQIGSGYESFASNRSPKPTSQNPQELSGSDLFSTDYLNDDSAEENTILSHTDQNFILLPDQ
jgi:hypothetical protein